VKSARAIVVPARSVPEGVKGKTQVASPASARLKEAAKARVLQAARPSPVLVRNEKRLPDCKARPKDNAPKGGSGSGARRFIPWC